MVVENDSDRPWYDRQFMRVDWSQNLIHEADFLLFARLDYGVRTEPVAYYVQDPSHPDAPRFDRDAKGRLDYMDVVNKVFVEPESVDFGDGYGAFPACWLLYSSHIDCAGGELTVRHSFRKVDPAAEPYQPENYTGQRMERAGFFVTERAGYDPEYGLVQDRKNYFVNRFNIWEQSYRKNDDGAFIGCASDADCGGNGAVCDDALVSAGQTTARVCTLPYRERTVKPFAYHLSERFPDDLVEDAFTVVNEWNGTLTETVGSLRQVECEEAGGTNCAAERDREDAKQVFVLCHNPVVEGDHAACGKPKTTARIGDLRYSFLAWVHEPHFGMPLGYGPSATDPETGEVIQGTAFIYGAGVEQLATYGRDLVALLNGDLSSDALITGENVAHWVDELRARDEVSVRPRDHHAVPIDGYDAARIAQSIDLEPVLKRRGASAPRTAPHSRKELVTRMHAGLGTLKRGDLFRRDNGATAAHLARLKDSPFEALLTSPDMLAAAGIDPALAASQVAIDRASPLRGMSGERLRMFQRERRRIAAERCTLRAEDFADDGLLGLARAVKNAASTGGTLEWYGRSYKITDDAGNVDYDAVRTMLRHPILVSTGEHEVGHTLGLRHNFSGSYDSLNYPANYWQLRNDGNMRPRAFDPLSDAEITARLREYQSSTVMDYGNNYIVTDAAGLGHYDRAAIKLGYGDLVEVFTDAADPTEMAWVAFQQLYGYPVAFRSTSFDEANPIRAYSYTDIPNLLGGLESIERRADVRFSSLGPEPGLAADGITEPLADAQGRPTVPYRFCSDEFADVVTNCQSYDAGADFYESVQSVADSYVNYYVFNNFRRQRLGYDAEDIYLRLYDRFFSRLMYANQDYAFNRVIVDDIFGGDARLDAFYTASDGMGADTAAIGAAFGLLSRVLATPEPGPYVLYTRADGTDAYFYDEYYEPDFEVPFPDGRYFETTWDFNAGYYWIDQLDRTGYFYDKILALETLADPQAYFFGADEAADLRAFQINFHTTFPEPTQGLFGALLAERWDVYGPRWNGSKLVYPDATAIAAASTGGDPIDPGTGYSVQLWGAFMGMSLIPLSYDHTFLESSRVFVAGGAEGVDLPSGETVQFVDPSTSIRYIAGSYPVAGKETGIGARMLLHAQALADNGEYYALDDYMDVVNLMRTLSWEYGFGY
ncbi:MAG: zinc-dependent metalloprotease [Polyangiales bacterium]